MNVDVDCSTTTDEYSSSETYGEEDFDEKKHSFWDIPTTSIFGKKSLTAYSFGLETQTTTTSFSNEKTQSMLNLGTPSATQKSSTLSPYGGDGGGASSKSSDERARSMEFLLNDSNKNAHLRVRQFPTIPYYNHTHLSIVRRNKTSLSAYTCVHKHIIIMISEQNQGSQAGTGFYLLHYTL